MPGSPGWCRPLPSPPEQHSEYSSVDFSHLGRGLRGRGTGQGAEGPQSSALRLQGYQRVICIWASALRTLAEEAARTEKAEGPASFQDQAWATEVLGLNRKATQAQPVH